MLQQQSVLLHLPAELRHEIIQYLIPNGLHLRVRNQIFVLSPCVGPLENVQKMRVVDLAPTSCMKFKLYMKAPKTVLRPMILSGCVASSHNGASIIDVRRLPVAEITMHMNARVHSSCVRRCKRTTTHYPTCIRRCSRCQVS
jgi:hypothetical protein